MRRFTGVLSLLLAVACGDDGDATDGAADAPADAAPADAGVDGDPRRRLSAENLYADFAAKTINPDLVEFEPRFFLWSDGALKRRWIELPAGQTIDTSDMDRWKFPAGTRLWKEFRTPEGALLETRLIEKLGAGDDAYEDYFMGAFVWQEDESEAFFEPAGMRNINGTNHDVPTETRCRTCHQGEAGFVLGFSAIQLSKATGDPTLATLEADGLLSNPPGRLFEPPGDATDQAALGTLHANCGHCHNPLGSAWPDVATQVLRLWTNESDGAVTATQIYTTTALWEDGSGQPFDYWVPPSSAVTHRLVPGDHAASALWYRMSQRGNGDAMPPIYSEAVDDVGLGAVETWIDRF
jgi:hypothetical protein